MQQDIKKWVRECHDCQCSKVTRHEKAPLKAFLKPDERFSQINIDIVGPLPTSKGFNYLLTCVDRFTRWIEAFPMADQTAETVAQTFFAGWVARFGTPLVLITDQGRNFISALFKTVSAMLGIEVRNTTGYHPQTNGMVERPHRTIKAALMSRLNVARENWSSELPVVLLGLRTAFKPDIGATSSQLVYGTTLRLPGEFFDKPVITTCPTEPYITNLHELLNDIKPTDTAWHSKPRTFTHTALNTCTHVYLRYDGVRAALQRPYTGPHLVMKRTPKTFNIMVGTRTVTVSRDRLKPAFTTVEDERHNEAISPCQSSSSATNSEPSANITRSGRQVHWPSTYADFVVS